MYNKTLVLLLSGKAGSGKTYSAKIMKKLFEDKGLNVATASFAYGVKWVAQEFMGWDREKDERGRKLLQDIGMLGRAYDNDCWVHYLMHQLSATDGYPYDIIIIDDWRFPNEYEYFKDDPEFNIVRVKFTAAECKVEMTEEAKKHISENALPEDFYDYLFVTDYIEKNTWDNLTTLCDLIDSKQSKYGEEKNEY